MIEGNGPHLMLDCFGCSNLNDFELVHGFLDDLPGLIGMHKLAPPYVIKQNKPHDQGVTGVVILEESHASIHTFAQTGLITIDVYSCKDYDPKTVIEFVKQKFSPQKISVNFVERGRMKHTAASISELAELPEIA